MSAMEEAVRKIRAQQGRPKSRVWHCGEHLLEFLGRFPQYADLISTDLDNKEMGLAAFEKKIAEAARANGGGIGGRDADAVLRKFYGLPAEGEDPISPEAPASPGRPERSGHPDSPQAAPDASTASGVHVDLSSYLL